MNITQQSPLENLISKFKTYDELKNELTKKLDDTNVYNISLKEDDNCVMIYYNTNNENVTDPEQLKLETYCRSVILDKSTLKPINIQYNKILYNEESINFVKSNNINTNQVVIQKCYEGTIILVFNSNNKWYVSTRRCLDARESVWANETSYYDMFMDAISNKFKLEDLNPNYCYQFILVHHLNRNIVNYDWLGQYYKEVYHILTNEKYTLKELNTVINSKVRYVQEEKFNTFEELFQELKTINDNDMTQKKISTEGYILRYYPNGLYKGEYTLLKFQTNIYNNLIKMKPNNNSIHQCFLELYQKDKLNEFITYFGKSKYASEVIKRINTSVQNLANEILILYYQTRNKSNPELYNKLTESYKQALYEIHGKFINSKKNDPNIKKSINVYDIYNYLKSTNAKHLRYLFHDRYNIIGNNKISEYPYINITSMETMTLCTLMFNNK